MKFKEARISGKNYVSFPGSPKNFQISVQFLTYYSYAFYLELDQPS